MWFRSIACSQGQKLRESFNPRGLIGSQTAAARERKIERNCRTHPSKNYFNFNATLHWTSFCRKIRCCLWPWHWNESENFEFFYASEPTCSQSLANVESTQSYVKFKYTLFNCRFLVLPKEVNAAFYYCNCTDDARYVMSVCTYLYFGHVLAFSLCNKEHSYNYDAQSV